MVSWVFLPLTAIHRSTKSNVYLLSSSSRRFRARSSASVFSLLRHCSSLVSVFGEALPTGTSDEGPENRGPAETGWRAKIGCICGPESWPCRGGLFSNGWDLLKAEIKQMIFWGRHISAAKLNSAAVGGRCQAEFLTSRHVSMHRMEFYIPNTLRKLLILGLRV